MKRYNMDLDAYNEFMRELKDDYSITYDTIVAKFIDRCIQYPNTNMEKDK